MTDIKAIIIDDEYKAAKYLEILISDVDSKIHIEEVITDPLLALSYLNNNAVDLVFLDINMPMMSGLDLLKQVDHTSFEIIFVTGYDEYAIKAFQACAIGYILKPVDEEDLASVLNYAKTRILKNQIAKHNRVLIENFDEKNEQKHRIGIQTADGLEFVKLDEIIRCEGLAKVTKVVAKNHQPLISSYSIGHFNKILKNYRFFACHKSHLVNTNHIKSIHRNGLNLVLNDDTIVPIARRRKAEFFKYMKLN